jgi:hypothetical protein
MYNRLTIFILTVLFYSCSGNLSNEEYISWVENEQNGLKIKRSSAAAEYILQYEPSFYKALSFSQYGKGEGLRKAKEQFEDLNHFMLKVNPKASAFTKEAELSRFLAYDLREKIRFTEGADTLDKTVMYHLESSGGISPYHRIMLAFPKAGATATLKLIIEPNKMDSGRQEFLLGKSALNKLKSINKKMQ